MYAYQHVASSIYFLFSDRSYTSMRNHKVIRWKCSGVRGLRSSDATGTVGLDVASGLIQAIFNLATSPLLGLPFTPTLIQSGRTCSAAAQLLRLRLELGSAVAGSPAHHSRAAEEVV